MYAKAGGKPLDLSIKLSLSTSFYWSYVKLCNL